ncbi:MAG: Terminase-like family protein [Okeania sp. SIO2C9]|uniref:phage terminase large subunit family protein n=1 Tax=Okeania sp. SIO2C9 TaxID=2607791 RepID=UPI0013C142B3|nr:terminase family protein [Okeania sp. SIO2C9]NEQ78222.1 Terminase-like family protein [Okeania sp. SIO2C9]
MFRVKPNLKQIKKYGHIKDDFLEIPEFWGEFVELTTIRSGGSMVRFKAYEYQKIMMNLANTYTNCVILKSRQMGVTQTIVSKFLQDAIRNPAASSIAFMRNGEDASAISRRCKQMLGSIPKYAVADNDNVGYLKIKNGGDVYFKNSSKEGSRSLDSATGMLFDEAAFVEKIQQIYAASSPSGALSAGMVQKFVVSTPSTKSGWYWDKLNQDNGSIDIEDIAIQVSEGSLYKEIPGLYWFLDDAGTCKIIIHFLAHPIYKTIPNYLEYRLKQDGTDWETVQREYNLRFVDSAVGVFSTTLIRDNVVNDLNTVFDPSSEYYAGLDTSTIGQDYCVFVVWKYSKNRLFLVDMYRKRHETSDYNLYQISKMIEKYKPKGIGIEITGGVGQVYLENLTKQFKGINIQSIRTTGDTKPTMISDMVLALERGQLGYSPQSPLIGEMLSFRRQGKKLEAAPGKHDDVVMATAFAISVSPIVKEKMTILTTAISNW